ncbi:MAG: hypothetical protein AAGI10_02485 [Pseudomonadota bacterium]
MRVRAPFGKCVDTSRVRQRDGSASVVLANCSNLGGRADAGAPDAALVLVTITKGTHGDLAALSDLVQANPALLARSGRAEDIELLEIERSSVALYVNLIDSGPGSPQGVSERHWKAALDIAGRAVVISVFGKVEGPLPGAAGEDLIRDTAQILLQINENTPPPANSGDGS